MVIKQLYSSIEKRWISWGQDIILAVLLAVFLVIPMVLVLIEAFFPDGHFTLRLFQAMAINPVFRQSLYNSLIIAVGSTLFASTLAIPFAVLLGRYRFTGRSFLQTAVILPLLLPPFAGTIALRQLLGRYGSVNILLLHLGWLKEPVDWLGGGRMGVIILAGLHLFPILYFSVVNHFAALNGESEEAALCFGGKTWAYYRKILLPEIRPGLFAGMALVFVWAFTDLGTPLLMEYRLVLPYQAFALVTDLNRNPMGFALVTVMGIVGLSGYWLSQAFANGKGQGQSQYQGKGLRQAREKTLSRWAGVIAVVSLAGILFLALLPIVALGTLSISKSWFLTIAPEAYTWTHYSMLWQHRITRGSIQTSLFLASLAVWADLILGWWIARRVLNTNGVWSKMLETLAMMPLALPGIILAFGYVAMFSGTPLDPAGNPLFLLVMAYAMRRLPFAFRSVLTGYRSLPAQIDEAAQTLGQGFSGRVWKIHLPLLTPYLLASGLLVFAFSMLEVSDSLVLAMQEFFYPITKAMFFLTSRAGDGNNLAAALAVVGMVILGVAIGIANRILRGKIGEMFRG